jgi:hypothetical protein
VRFEFLEISKADESSAHACTSFRFDFMLSVNIRTMRLDGISGKLVTGEHGLR